MAVGSVIQSLTSFVGGEEFEESHDYGPFFGHKVRCVKAVTFLCTGGTVAETGTIPNTDIISATMDEIKGLKLQYVTAFPTVGGTAPDAGDVFIIDADGIDLLGSADANLTAYNGLNLIHATLPRRAYPTMYIPRAGAYQIYTPVITNTLTLKVLNQITSAAHWTITLVFA